MPRRTRDRRIGRIVAGLTASLLAFSQVGLVLAAQTWTVTANRVTVPLNDSTTVTLTITNTSGDDGGGAGIGCVTIAIPTAYIVTGASVASVSTGLSWAAKVSDSSPRGVKAQANSNGDRLRGDPDDDVLVLKVTVTGEALGLNNWTANEFQGSNCNGNFNHTLPVLMTVVGLPTPAPTPKPTPKPSPTAAPTPRPTAVPTATPTRSPGPTALPTDRPSADPSASAEPSPSSAPAATAGPTATPAIGLGGPTATPAIGLGGPPAAPDPPADGGHFEGVISIPVDAADPSFPGLRVELLASLGVFAWAVPGALLVAPGLLLIVVILAQSIGALAWLPIVRRKIGGFGPTHRLTSPRGPA